MGVPAAGVRVYTAVLSEKDAFTVPMAAAGRVTAGAASEENTVNVSVFPSQTANAAVGVSVWTVSESHLSPAWYSAPVTRPRRAVSRTESRTSARSTQSPFSSPTHVPPCCAAAASVWVRAISPTGPPRVVGPGNRKAVSFITVAVSFELPVDSLSEPEAARETVTPSMVIVYTGVPIVISGEEPEAEAGKVYGAL
jgi:hypothetical protein